MAIKIDTLKAGDVVYYPLPKNGWYHTLNVVSVDLQAHTAVISNNGRTRTVTQRDCNRYRRTPPKAR